ncbi:speckle targeted PIP5K1A-regulated poly(A) polymerase [Trichonephila inaurata madagascariensis]|uniref:Speckle targeted PIP5K1A-regulated poly(A) polymerase n=1 Tax=Trichonephila inaurata madagascariensis TaxID=2747483 RepID=A0A8X6WWL2_9ARAC|nr:speckle targeted PIP5K1A-regulated poly(A) polymerase [Trichonephila inaurata madagascariensis]
MQALSIETYLPCLEAHNTVSEKMKELSKLSSLKNHEKSRRKLICQYIHKLLLPYFPDCIIKVFGSSVNGLGTEKCDLDLMFSPYPDFKYEDISVDKDEPLPSRYDVRRYSILRERLKRMSREKQLCFILRVLRSDKGHVTFAAFIPARCPIVKFNIIFMHDEVSCDLSFDHRLALYNTKLLRFLVSIDPRVQPLMITLRFWAKYLNLISIGRLSSYCFTLLVIFFLQNIENPILPSVNFLMKDTKSVIVDGREVGFTCDLSKVPKTKNNKREDELLEEFFSFYWSFNFLRDVICIRTGKAQPIKDFIESNDEIEQKFLIRDICVQDPFDVSFNVGSSIKLHGIPLLKPSMYVANLILRKNLCNETDDVFKLLFDEAFYKTTIENFMSFSDMQSWESLVIHPDYDILAILGTDDKSLSLWYERSSDAILNILNYIFFFNCEVINKNFCDENPNEESNFTKKPSLLLSIQCAADIRIWKHRNAKIDVPMEFYDKSFDNIILRKENALSHFTLKSFPLCRYYEPIFWFSCDIYKSNIPQFPFLLITFMPLTISVEFTSAVKALKKSIPNIVRNILKN